MDSFYDLFKNFLKLKALGQYTFNGGTEICQVSLKISSFLKMNESLVGLE